MTQSPTLYSLIIRLTATHTAHLRMTQGHLAHAAFLHIVQQVDPALSQTLHDTNGRKPFTLSPLEGFGQGRDGQLPIHAGQEGCLRVTLLDPALFHTFIRYFLKGTVRPIIRLDNTTFHITEILSTPGSHPLAGYTTLSNLWQQWETAVSPSPHISLEFRTPTAFSLKNSPHRVMHILPDPALVFGQLASYWDDLTGHSTKEAVREFAARHVVVARHKIETHMYEFRKSKQVGFTGRVTFEILDKQHLQLTQHLHRLADLAFYTGVGSKTTQGMGQVKKV